MFGGELGNAGRFAWAVGGFLGLALVGAWAHDEANLRSPDGSDRPRAEARIGEDEIRLRGDDLPQNMSLTILIADADGVLQDAFSVKTDSEGEFEVEAGAGSLPLGAASPSDFAGRAIEVHGPEGSPLLVGTFPKASAEAENEVGVGTGALNPPSQAPLPAASGRIRLKAELNRHEIEVRVLGLQAESVYSVCLIDSAGSVEQIGKITTNLDGNGALEIDTDDGGALPFGAAGAQDLVGLTVKVKDKDGATVLEGTVPALGEVEKENELELEVELDLGRAEDSPEHSIRGDVRLESEMNDDGDKSRVRIRDTEANATFSVEFVQPSSPETPDQFGELTTDIRGEAQLEKQGLPLGATTISELGGVLVHVFNSAGTLVLEGTLPQVGTPPQPPPDDVPLLRFEVRLMQPDPSILAEAHGKVDFEEESDEHEMEVEVEDLPPGAHFKVELRDPTGSAEVLVEKDADELGDVRKQTLFLGNDPLPFGVKSFGDLDGFTIAVLNADGETVLHGGVSVPGSGAALQPPLSFNMLGRFDAPFLRGDANRDFTINITDAINSLETLFLGKAFLGCEDALDANDDGRVDVSDPVSTLIHLFLGGPEVPFPGTNIPGFDPTPDGLFCQDR